MKMLYPEYMGTVTASTENANFPDENLTDEHPKKVWKGTGRAATVTIVSSNSNGMAIFKTNSESLVVTITEGNSIAWDTTDAISWDTDRAWDDNVNPLDETFELSGDDEGAGWVEWVERVANHTIVVSLDAGAGNIIEAGIISVGIINDFNDPLNRLQERLVDYSIVKELNNGAFYVRNRDVVREFAGSIIVERDDDFYLFMMDILKKKGQKPIPIRLNSTLTNWEWLIYGRMRLATGEHDTPSYSRIHFNLLEVL